MIAILMRRGILRCLPVLLLAAPSAVLSSAELAPLSSVPLDLSGQAPTVEVRINGEGPFTFAIHTGVGQSAISAPVAERLGLPVVGTGWVGAPEHPLAMEGDRVRAEVLLLGAVELRDAALIRLDLSEAMKDDVPDGLLGFELLGDYLWTLDFAGERLILERGALPDADGEHVVAFRLDRHGGPIITAGLGSHDLDVRLDSSQFGSVALPGTLREELPLSSEPGRIGRTSDPRGTFDLYGARLDGDLRFGGYAVPHPRVLFSDGFEDAGLGPAALEEFAVTFDPANRRARFERKESRKAQRLREAAAAVPTLDGKGELRTAFNGTADKVRLLLILSPT